MNVAVLELVKHGNVFHENWHLYLQYLVLEFLNQILTQLIAEVYIHTCTSIKSHIPLFLVFMFLKYKSQAVIVKGSIWGQIWNFDEVTKQVDCFHIPAFKHWRYQQT